MPRFPCRGALCAAILYAAGCGYVGGPLTPLANVPNKINDLAAIQRGAQLIVHCSVPTHTTENNPINTPLALDLRIGPGGDHFAADEWARQARAITNPQIQGGLATYLIPTADWTGKEVILGVRAAGANRKAGAWSNFVVVPVVAAPETPSAPTVQDIAAGERVTWTGRGDQFRVLRRTSGEQNFTVAATVEPHEWLDPDIDYGKTYEYEIQALVKAGNDKIAESAISPPTSQTPKDVFPPAVPGGLRFDLTPSAVSLVWEPVGDADLAGYSVYRSDAGGPWHKLADTNTVPSYTDATVEHGKTYRYAVRAFDKAGNPSELSAAVEVIFP